MKIAFFNYLELEKGGGTSRFFLDVSQGLKKNHPNLDVAIVTLDKSLNKLINRLYSIYFQKNIEKDLTSLKKISLNESVNYLKATSISELRTILGKFDVVYSKNDFIEAFILKILVGKKFLKKLIFGFHTPIYYEKIFNFQSRLHNLLYTSILYKFLIKDADKYHVLNSKSQEILKGWFRNKIVKKIYNPFPAEMNKKELIRYEKDLTIDHSSLKLLWVGRLTVEKGADHLIGLISTVNTTEQAKKIVWYIVGSGELDKNIKKLAAKYENIKYQGYLNQNDLKIIYRKCDLFLSTSKFESFPYTFIEAQTYGLPIVSYNISGCNEIVKDGLTGYLVTSLEEIEEKIVYLVNNKNKLIKRDIVRKNIKKLIDNQEIYKKLYELLQ